MTIEGKEIAIFQPPDESRFRPRAVLLVVAAGFCLLASSPGALYSRAMSAVSNQPPSPLVDAVLRSDGERVTPSPHKTALSDTTTAAGKQVLAAPFMFAGTTLDRLRAVDCLAKAAWYEAGDDAESQRSVIQVILNRVDHPAFPNSVCGVVFQGSERRTGCQFTFTCDGSLFRRQPSAPAISRARSLAELALAGTIDPSVQQATHYHADYVTPWWSSKLVQLGTVGRHIFYRWPGLRGNLPGNPIYSPEIDVALLPASRPRGVAGDASGETLSAAEAATLGIAAVQAPSIAPEAVLELGGGPPPSQAILLAVNTNKPSGRWAVDALSKCAGKAGCQVLAYSNSDAVERNRTRRSLERERPLFAYVRDAASGMELAQWDCNRVDRPAAKDCMASAGPEFQRLMRER